MDTDHDPHACSEAIAPLATVLEQLNSKWTIPVLGTLVLAPSRFGELKAAIGGISQKELTRTLRDMEEGGLVTRIVVPTLPPRVDYTLTDAGRSLCTTLDFVHAWAHDNQRTMQDARRRFVDRDA